jgi:hypothetical protein
MASPVKVTFAKAGTLTAFTTPLCDAWVIEGCDSFADFLAIYDQKSAANPDHHIFASLDDYSQACYTSGHAMGKYDLDPTDGDGGAELSSAEKFATTYTKFIAQTGKVAFADLAGRLMGNAGDDEPSLVDLNTNPDQCLDREIVMQIVPVTLPEDALAAFPNGYFSDDLTPFDNHALAAHLRNRYGYKLIAIGAAYVCFLRDEVVDEADAKAVATDIVALYSDVDEVTAVSGLAAVLSGKRYLITNYADL